MIYSVWNQGRGVYDYYQTPGNQETANAPKPKHLRSTQLGMTPAQAAWPLPAGAKKVGSGEFARGRVAAPAGAGSLGGFFDLDLTMTNIILLGLSGFLVWKYVLRR